MAALNLRTVADRVLGLLRSEDVQRLGSVYGVLDEKHLQGLGNAISSLTPLLLDAEKQASDNGTIAEWLIQLGWYLFHAENLLGELATEASMMLSTGKTISKQVCSFFLTTSHPIASRLNFRRSDMDYLKRRILEIEAELRGFDLREGIDKEIQFPTGVQEEIGSLIMRRCRDNADEMEIINILLMDMKKFDHQEEQNVTSVLPILGKGQLETTRIVWGVFTDERVRNHFHKRIWLHLSGMSNINNAIQILNELIARVHPRHIEGTDMDKLIKLLGLSLSGVRFLIVFDQVLTEYSLVFLRGLLDMGERGSKIIVTTCNKDVASKITGSDTIQPYGLACPSEEELWFLFEKVAFRGQEPKHSSMIDIGKKIMKRCIGLPDADLAITTIGSMLYFENSEADWLVFYENELSKIGKANHNPFPFSLKKSGDYAEVLPLLKLCYDHLPSPLKDCFAYCSLFPKGHEIDVQTMIKLWMAQDFTIMEQPEKCAEDVGYEYVLNLLGRSFFGEPTKDVRECVIKCKMHHLMHDLATLVAGVQCFLFSPDAFNKRRLSSYHVSFGSGLFSAEVATSFSQRNVHSLLLQSPLLGNYGGRRGNNTLFDQIIRRYVFLRALDMRASGIKIVPNSVGKLKLLKYLDLSGNEDIKKLPNSITKLWNLQTLRLSSCFKLRQLSRDIRNLINLRHLEIDGCSGMTGMPRGFGHLTNLRTLSQIVLSRDSSTHDVELNEVKGLRSLRGELRMKILKPGEDVATYLNVVPRGVLCLSLEWGSHENHAPKIDFIHKRLDCNQLVKLSLMRNLYCQSLPSVDQLSHLKVLVLDDMSKLEYISYGKASSLSSSTTTFFPSLQELWLTELPKLQRWWKDEVDELLPSFPCLSKLVIEDCPNLASMPLFPTLKIELVLDSTSLKPFKLTMSNQASSSSSSSSSSPLSDLKSLCFVGIDELNDSNVDEITWGTLKSLRFLRFDCLLQLTTLPLGLRDIISLKELHIWRCGVKEIDVIEALEYLVKLVIRVCPALESLPEGIRNLEYLETLEIEDCPTLLRRCEKKTGADWDKIAHIPNKRLVPISGR